MSSFTTRIELHNATWSDYDKLHTEATKRGFSNVIVADGGARYRLPTAEYNFVGTATRAQILELAKSAAAPTGKKFAVIVTESAGRTWEGLEAA